MVRQLLTVTRLESGALKPRTEVVSLSTRARKAWEALGVDDVPFDARRRGRGLAGRRGRGSARPGALGAARQRGQVRCRQPGPGHDRASTRPTGRRAADHRGPGARASPRRTASGCSSGSRAGPRRDSDGGSGLGLYVSRELCRAMGGDLVLEPAAAGGGAAFTIVLPGRARRRGLRPAVAVGAGGGSPDAPRPARDARTPGPGGPGVSVLVACGQAGLGRALGGRTSHGGGRRTDGRRFQIIPRGSPTIRPAAAAPMIGPRTGLTLRISASMAPAYQPV